MEVIAGHANTDFDCFASMLACRRLYPAAVVALSGSLNRNVREFYRLHADEIPCVEAARLELDAISRLVCVEATNPARLGDLEAVARRSDVDVVLFDHHRDERPDWLPQENVVLSDDGALTTTLVGIIAEREPAVTPLEATVFALGIHEDTGSLTYPTATQRDAEALAWCLRHGARQEMVSRYLHAPLGEDERALLDALLASLETHGVAGVELLLAAVAWPTYVDGVSNLAHKVVDLTDSRALVCSRRDGGSRRGGLPEPNARGRHVRARPGPRRRGPSSGVVRDVPRHARRGPGCSARRASAGGARAAHRGSGHVAPRALRVCRRHRRPRDGAVPAPSPERYPGGHARGPGRAW